MPAPNKDRNKSYFDEYIKNRGGVLVPPEPVNKVRDIINYNNTLLLGRFEKYINDATKKLDLEKSFGVVGFLSNIGNALNAVTPSVARFSAILSASAKGLKRVSTEIVNIAESANELTGMNELIEDTKIQIKRNLINLATGFNPILATLLPSVVSIMSKGIKFLKGKKYTSELMFEELETYKKSLTTSEYNVPQGYNSIQEILQQNVRNLPLSKQTLIISTPPTEIYKEKKAPEQSRIKKLILSPISILGTKYKTQLPKITSAEQLDAGMFQSLSLIYVRLSLGIEGIQNLLKQIGHILMEGLGVRGKMSEGTSSVSLTEAIGKGFRRFLGLGVKTDFKRVGIGSLGRVGEEYSGEEEKGLIDVLVETTIEKKRKILPPLSKDLEKLSKIYLRRKLALDFYALGLIDDEQYKKLVDKNVSTQEAINIIDDVIYTVYSDPKLLSKYREYFEEREYIGNLSMYYEPVSKGSPFSKFRQFRYYLRGREAELRSRRRGITGSGVGKEWRSPIEGELLKMQYDIEKGVKTIKTITPKGLTPEEVSELLDISDKIRNLLRLPLSNQSDDDWKELGDKVDKLMKKAINDPVISNFLNSLYKVISVNRIRIDMNKYAELNIEDIEKSIQSGRIISQESIDKIVVELRRRFERNVKFKNIPKDSEIYRRLKEEESELERKISEISKGYTRPTYRKPPATSTRTRPRKEEQTIVERGFYYVSDAIEKWSRRMDEVRKRLLEIGSRIKIKERKLEEKEKTYFESAAEFFLKKRLKSSNLLEILFGKDYKKRLEAKRSKVALGSILLASLPLILFVSGFGTGKLGATVLGSLTGLLLGTVLGAPFGSIGMMIGAGLGSALLGMGALFRFDMAKGIINTIRRAPKDTMKTILGSAILGFALFGRTGATLGMMLGLYLAKSRTQPGLTGALIKPVVDLPYNLIKSPSTVIGPAVLGAIVGSMFGIPFGTRLGLLAGAYLGSLITSGGGNKDSKIFRFIKWSVLENPDSIIGAVIGGLLGFAVGGPIGAKIGATVGVPIFGTISRIIGTIGYKAGLLDKPTGVFSGIYYNYFSDPDNLVFALFLALTAGLVGGKKLAATVLLLTPFLARSARGAVSRAISLLPGTAGAHEEEKKTSVRVGIEKGVESGVTGYFLGSMLARAGTTILGLSGKKAKAFKWIVTGALAGYGLIKGFLDQRRRKKERTSEGGTENSGAFSLEAEPKAKGGIVTGKTSSITLTQKEPGRRYGYAAEKLRKIDSTKELAGKAAKYILSIRTRSDQSPTLVGEKGPELVILNRNQLKNVRKIELRPGIKDKVVASKFLPITLPQQALKIRHDYAVEKLREIGSTKELADKVVKHVSPIKVGIDKLLTLVSKNIRKIDLEPKAEGGIVTGRKVPFLVGETGPEILTLPKGSEVIPTEKLSKLGLVLGNITPEKETTSKTKKIEEQSSAGNIVSDFALLGLQSFLYRKVKKSSVAKKVGDVTKKAIPKKVSDVSTSVFSAIKNVKDSILAGSKNVIRSLAGSITTHSKTFLKTTVEKAGIYAEKLSSASVKIIGQMGKKMSYLYHKAMETSTGKVVKEVTSTGVKKIAKIGEAVKTYTPTFLEKTKNVSMSYLERFGRFAGKYIYTPIKRIGAKVGEKIGPKVLYAGRAIKGVATRIAKPVAFAARNLIKRGLVTVGRFLSRHLVALGGRAALVSIKGLLAGAAASLSALAASPLLVPAAIITAVVAAGLITYGIIRWRRRRREKAQQRQFKKEYALKIRGISQELQDSNISLSHMANILDRIVDLRNKYNKTMKESISKEDLYLKIMQKKISAMQKYENISKMALEGLNMLFKGLEPISGFLGINLPDISSYIEKAEQKSELIKENLRQRISKVIEGRSGSLRLDRSEIKKELIDLYKRDKESIKDILNDLENSRERSMKKLLKEVIKETRKIDKGNISYVNNVINNQTSSTFSISSAHNAMMNRNQDSISEENLAMGRIW